MKRIWMGALAAMLVGLTYAPALAQDEPKTCEDWRCEFQQALEQDCDCAGKSNHGRYVSCVAHAVKDLVDEGLPRNCKGKLKRCAARSVCGKQDRGFVTCGVPVKRLSGVCVLSTSTTTAEPAGNCSQNAELACTTDEDCIVRKCKIKRSEERCLAKDGLVNSAPSCCSSCAVPAEP